MKIENYSAPHKSAAPSNPCGGAELRTQLDWALAYAKRGWSVFPLHSVQDGRCTCGRDCGKNTGKHPRVKGGFKAATADAQQIETWWRKWPNANIGIRTGAGLIVIDIDGANGLATLQSLLAQYGALPRTAIVKTARGWHCYFAMPSSCPPISCSAGDALDVRGDGGYCVAPPSRHASGHVYQWYEEANTLAEAPSWLQEWARSRSDTVRPAESMIAALGEKPHYLKSRTASAPSIAARIVKALKPAWSAHAEAELRSALKFIPADNYDTWYRVGMALQQLEWDRADGTSIGFDIWDEWSATCPDKYSLSACETKWGSFGRTPYSGQPITEATIFHWAFERGWQKCSASNAQTEFPSTYDSNNLSAQGSAAVASPRAQLGINAMFSAADLRKMTFEPVRYVLPNFIPEGMTLLVGRPKVGKSWWVLDLCLACAGDRAALGAIKPAQGDVLYLALEDGKRRLQRRIDKLMSPFGGEWPERLSLVPSGNWRRADQGGLVDIEAWCTSKERKQRPVLVVVDTLERFRKPASGKGPLYSADYEAITGLQKIAIDHGIAIIVLHHDRKSEADDAFDTVSGTLGLTGAADTILIIKRRSNGVVLYARGRDIEESETAMQFDKASCRWTILGAASDVHRSNERAQIVAALKTAGKPLATKEIMIEIGQENRNAIDVLLYKMVKAGEIERVGRGCFQLSTADKGQIGQKERIERQATESPAEKRNLSDLSDLSESASHDHPKP